MGSVRLFAILGDPIAQVKTPAGITREFLDRDINAIVVPFHVPPADFDAVFASLRRVINLEGLVITVPHKMAVTRHLTSATDRARFLGAANVVRRTPDGGWHGDVTDGLGMLGALRQAGCEPMGKRVLLVGAGGAGSAIALALVEAGAAQLAVHDTDAARRDGLVGRLKERGADAVTGSTDPAGFDLVINASTCGMKAGDPLPVDASRIAPGTVTADVITLPARTPFLEAAASRHCHTVPGTSMFAAQVGLVADFLLGASSEL